MSSPPSGFSSPLLPSSPSRSPSRSPGNSRNEETLFVSNSSPLGSSDTIIPQNATRPLDSSPLPLASTPQSLPSSSLSSSLRNDRDHFRTLGSSQTRARRGELASSDIDRPSELNSEPTRVIWGTNVSISETYEIFQKFLSEFKMKDRLELDGITVLPGEAEEPYYMDILEDMLRADIVNLNLDVRNLLAYAPSSKLYYRLINYPSEVVPLMDGALKEHLSRLVESTSANPTAELNAIETKAYKVRPYGLPAKTGLRELNPKDIDKLVTVKGLVLRATPIIPEMGDAFFKCAVCNHTVVVEIDRGMITEPKKCPRPACDQINSMQLIHNRCRFSDKQVIKLQETPDVIPDGQTPHTVSLCVYDDLVDYCRAGDRIEVTGIFRGAPVRANPFQRVLKSLYKTHVDVIHIRKDNPKRLGVDTSTREDEDKELSEEVIDRIRETANRMDLFDLLSRSVAPSIYENEDVKKGILLQLFGGTNKTFTKGGKPRYRGDINILLCGDPSTSKSQMLTYVHKIAPRGMYTSGKGSSAVGLTAYITKDTETKQLVLESGALVLSDGGICCIDEFDKMSDSTRSVLHEVMEQQTVSIAKAGIITTLNARTSILASANPIGSRYNTKLPVVQNIDLPPTLLSRFDLVYLMIDKVDSNADRRLAKHLTNMYLDDSPENGSEEEIVDVEFLANYISYAKKHVHPKISYIAKEELVKNYVQMRSLGESNSADERRITATTRQLESMIRLSEAHAKMRLSSTVDRDDVIEAARLIRSAIKEYATDPITGTIDMDLVQTGQSRAQREQFEQFKVHVMELLSHNPGGLPYDDVVKTVANVANVRSDSSDVSLVLRELIQEGVLTLGPHRIVRKIADLS